MKQTSMNVKKHRLRSNYQTTIACFFSVFFTWSAFSTSVAARDIKTEFQDVQPKYIKTETGYAGICVEIIDELRKGLSRYGLNIVSPESFTPPIRIRSHLAEGSFDFHCGAARNKAREKTFGFSEKPLYSISTIVVGRADETLTIHSMDDLVKSQAAVSSVRGTNTAKLLSSRDGLLLGPMPSESESGLAMLKNERIRFFVYHDLGIHWLLKKMDRARIFRIQPAVLRQYSHWMMYSPRLDPDIRQLIEKELERLHNSKVIKEIINRYRLKAPRKIRTSKTALPSFKIEA
ncbi:MAG: transporter substrate-binding domain-containing protein [Thermodesulfobacteriota bacterium]